MWETIKNNKLLSALAAAGIAFVAVYTGAVDLSTIAALFGFGAETAAQ